MGAQLDAVDEQREGKDVEQADGRAVGCEGCEGDYFDPSSGSGFFLLVPNIYSMRSVTMKPPTTLTVPKTIAMKPMMSLKVLVE